MIGLGDLFVILDKSYQMWSLIFILVIDIPFKNMWVSSRLDAIFAYKTVRDLCFEFFLPQIYKKSKCFNNQLELSDEVRAFLIDMFLKKTNKRPKTLLLRWNSCISM